MTTHFKSLSPPVGLSRLFAIIQLCSLLPQNICKYSKFDFALLAQRGYGPTKRICHDEYFERITKPA